MVPPVDERHPSDQPPPPAPSERRPGSAPDAGFVAETPVWARGAGTTPTSGRAAGPPPSARPPGQPPAGGPPPPPSRAVRGDGPARLTAATVVSATGALLLLAAAATFLAVSWDTLGLTARVAAVGAGTAAAIVGGARLRRTLPAVGGVVFHLGALLLPVDALGLALQLDVGPAGAWIAVGATALVTLPVAAHVGRSRVLSAAALAGAPVLATGLGLAGLAPAPLLIAAAAVAALLAVRVHASGADDPRIVLGLAAPALAITAVAGPLLVAAGSAVAGAGGGPVLRAAASAGWLPTTWSQPASAGLVAVGALAATAVLRRSTRWAGAVPVLVALVAVTLLLPGDAPRLARLLPWPLLFLAVESIAVAVRRDRTLGPALARTAVVSEAVAALAVPGALWTVASATRSVDELIGWFGFEPGSLVGDPVLAATAAVTAVAWAVAVVRRGAGGLAEGEAAIAAAAAGTATAAAAATLLAPAAGLGVLVCLVGCLASVVVRGGALRGVGASLAAIGFAGSAVVGTWSVALVPQSTTVGEVLLALVAGAVAVALTGRIAQHAGAGEGAVAAVLLLPLTTSAVLVSAAAIESALGLSVAVLVACALLLACAALLGGAVAIGADALRGLAAASALFAGPTATVGLDDAVTAAPAGLLVATVLAVEAFRCRRAWLLVAAGPVLVRAVAGVAYAVTDDASATGTVLLGLAVVAAVVATLRPDVRVAGAVTAVVAGVSAFTLLSLTPGAIAWGTVAVGLTVVAVGLITRRVPVAHVGGVVTTLGVWQLLALEDVTAVDVWLLAPAAQLWLLGLPARRRGQVSSWVADVPPFALVVVPALLERLAGGSGWHAALAGGLALVATVGGGVGRHAGPLVVGVVAVVAVVAIETLAVVADVPTWAWLTVGGVVLVGAGALIERTGGAPVATVRRLADVLTERFD